MSVPAEPSSFAFAMLATSALALLVSEELFAGDLLCKKTSKASAGTHNNQPKPQALERDQLTNPKTYCASDNTSDRSGKSMFWTVPF
jgi:hypothetical protein